MIIDLGIADFEDCYKTQRQTVIRRKLGEIDDTLILAEHNSVFTLGRSGTKESLIVDEDFLLDKGIKVIKTDRGGGITFHGQGQLVIYPIIELKSRWQDLHRYMRNLEDVVIKFLKRYDVRPERRKGKTGVWASGKKIASIGIGVSGWVTYHGVSININPDLEFFDMIYPCGSRDVKMTSLAELTCKTISMEEVKGAVISDFDKVFNSGKGYFAEVNYDRC